MRFAIKAESLVKKYGDIIALDNVSLEVQQGEIFGFLGPNGAGKSSFVKILLNLISPSSGNARIFDVPVESFLSRKHVGFLPENILVYKFLTVKEFMLFHADLAGLPAGRNKEESSRCIDLLSMGDSRNKRLGTLSKGMLQRVAIAQAILGHPKLVFLDEPTNGLDPIGIRDLRKLLSEMKNRGTTIFLNSHLLSEIERTCDRIAILNKGKIIKIGTKQELSSTGKHLVVTVDSFTDLMAKEINEISTKPVQQIGNIIRIFPLKEKYSMNVHKIIADNGGRILSLSWEGESLEELFYRMVKHEDMGNS